MTEEIKTKIAQSMFMTGGNTDSEKHYYQLGADAALSLCAQQMQAKDKEVEKWEGLYNLTEQQRKEWADTCINKAKEIERLNGLLEEVHRDYNQQKYLMLGIRLTEDQYRNSWQQFKTDNKL